MQLHDAVPTKLPLFTKSDIISLIYEPMAAKYGHVCQLLLFVIKFSAVTDLDEFFADAA